MRSCRMLGPCFDSDLLGLGHCCRTASLVIPPFPFPNSSDGKSWTIWSRKSSPGSQGPQLIAQFRPKCVARGGERFPSCSSQPSSPLSKTAKPTVRTAVTTITTKFSFLLRRRPRQAAQSQLAFLHNTVHKSQ